MLILNGLFKAIIIFLWQQYYPVYTIPHMPCNVSLRSLKLVPRGGSLVQHNRTINHVAIDPRPDLALLQRHPGLDDQKG